MSPTQFFNRIKKALLRRIKPKMCSWARSSQFARIIYYSYFNRAFDREMRTVLHGRNEFDVARTSEGKTHSLLRRNIHRIEKGLIMRPRRTVFATDYIEETIDFYLKVMNFSNVITPCDEELKWARDVLQEYFSVTDNDPVIDRSRSKFNSINFESTVSSPLFKPYSRRLNDGQIFPYETLIKLAVRRRSVRWYQQRAVPRYLIEKALNIARLSPSACNRQPFYFHVFDSPDEVIEIANLPGGTKGFAHNFPAIIAVIGEFRNYYDERDRHVIYIDVGLAAMSFMFAAETLGLSTCCINWPDIEENEMRADKVLKLSPDQRPICFISVGFADPEGGIPYSQKKSIQEIARFNWEN